MPLSTVARLERIQSFLTAGEDDGAVIWQPSHAVPQEGFFLPPTLCTGAPASSPIVTDEIFGPVLVSLTFRTPAEAVALANDTRYGLAASIWTEDLSLALDVAPAIKAGTVWVNCTNRFDAASGFGGYRESGFGREGGREGMWEYLKPVASVTAIPSVAASDPVPTGNGSTGSAPGDPIDRTRKLWIGGRQMRPDGGYSLTARDASGAVLAEVPRGNRKDVRNAVEAAAGARGSWAATTAYLRSQILYFVAENLAVRADEFAVALRRATGVAPGGRERRGGCRGPGRFHLRRMGGQARRQRALHAVPERHLRHERARGHGGDPMR